MCDVYDHPRNCKNNQDTMLQCQENSEELICEVDHTKKFIVWDQIFKYAIS